MPHDQRLLLKASRFDVVEQSYRGSDGRTHTRQTVLHGGSVVILPVLPDGRLALIRNYRISVDESLLELPAGALEAGEDPARAAVRELAEETGYRANRIDKLLEFFVSPGILNERMHLYVARDLAPGPAALEPGEEIEPALVTQTEALDLITSGVIRDAKTIIGVLYWLHKLRGAA